MKPRVRYRLWSENSVIPEWVNFSSEPVHLPNKKTCQRESMYCHNGIVVQTFFFRNFMSNAKHVSS